MRRSRTFTLKVSEDERAMLEFVAGRLQRSQSDVVRLLIREIVNQLATDADIEEKLKPGREEICPEPKGDKR